MNSVSYLGQYYHSNKTSNTKPPEGDPASLFSNTIMLPSASTTDMYDYYHYSLRLNTKTKVQSWGRGASGLLYFCAEGHNRSDCLRRFRLLVSSMGTENLFLANLVHFGEYDRCFFYFVILSFSSPSIFNASSFFFLLPPQTLYFLW